MTPTEYEKAGELAALWPECLDTQQQSGVWVASGHLQDYLEAARKRWPGMFYGYFPDWNSRDVFWVRPLGNRGSQFRGTGATDCERILSAFLEAAKGEA